MPINMPQRRQDSSFQDAMGIYDAYRKFSGDPQKVEVSNAKDFSSTGNKDYNLKLDQETQIDQKNYDPNLMGGGMTLPQSPNMPPAQPPAASAAPPEGNQAMQRKLDNAQAAAKQNGVPLPGQKQKDDGGAGSAISAILTMLA